ncbi:FAD-dependent oxidoreductase [Peptococcus simiae]|uniref:FAD-dependent oxidoreductase n=1 Tax=Peptococcus simiae TaxID=1643805 RepID=A0ABW9H1M5_9FIRM
MKKWRHLLCLVVIFALGLTGCSTGQKSTETVERPTITNAEKVADQYDVIVVGGDPEGIAAAISAARNGQKTLLLCASDQLGGLYTDGELNFIDVPETRDGTQLVHGIYDEFFKAVGGSGFDIDKACQVFFDMVKAEDNITLRVNSQFKSPIMEGNTLRGVIVTEDGAEKAYRGDVMIDATTDADLAAATGAPYTYAGEDIGEKDREMGVTLVFGLKGLDWDKIVRHLTVQRAKGEVGKGSTDMGAKDNIAWGYTREGYGYEPSNDAVRLRGFNMSRQSDGTVLFNALILFDVNPLDPASRADGIARGQKELEKIVPYLRETCVGFEKAELANTARDLYVRESRHIEAEYMLTIDDVLENRPQPDMVAVSNYPVDVQPTKAQKFGTVIGFPDQYAIGLRSLVPKNVDQLFVVGRSAGFRSMAAGSARIVPTGMACAQGAGVAAAVARERGMSPRALCYDDAGMKEVQTRLKDQGANLNHVQTREAVMDHWAYPGVKTLRSMGFLDGGYDNNYKLDDLLSKNRYQNMINGSLRKLGFPPDPAVLVNDNPPVRQVIGTMARAAAELEGRKLPDDFQTYRHYLMEKGILTQDLAAYFSEPEKQPQGAEATQLVANFYQWGRTLPGAQQLIGVE